MTTTLKSLGAMVAMLGGTAGAVIAVQSNEPPVPTLKASPAPVTEMKCAVEPKALTEAVKNGLAWLAKSQQDDGGWNQGGGWRTDLKTNGKRIEGKEVEDPSDIGNSAVALLALVRAGNTTTTGDYKTNVEKGLKFVLDKVEKADSDSLFVTDVRNTQLQSKIGTYVDTFVVNLVLAELKGKSGELEKRLASALDKTIAKIAKNQQADGQFAANAGWAPVLSLSLCNKGLTRARLSGAKVDDVVIERFAKQSQQPKQPAAGTATTAFAPRSDAGVPIYGDSARGGNSQDAANVAAVDAAKAKAVIADPKATEPQKQEATTKAVAAEKVVTDNVGVQRGLQSDLKSESFVAGFGSNGGEEFLSFLNISETLVLAGGTEWEKWDRRMSDGLNRTQDKEGSWSGHHCITGKTFCTAGALLVLTADRMTFPPAVIEQAKKDAVNRTEAAKKAEAEKKAAEKKDEKK